MSTSLLHISLSIVARHWIFITFLFLCVLWILTKHDVSSNEKLLFSSGVVALGMGVSAAMILTVLLILIWIFFFERKSLRSFVPLLKGKAFWGFGLLLVSISFFPYLVYQRSLGFRDTITVRQGKTFLGFIDSILSFVKDFFFSKPILFIFMVLGLVFLFIRRKSLFLSVGLFFFTYVATFYLVFLYQQRNMLPLMPLFSLIAGYGLYCLCGKFQRTLYRVALIGILLIPLISSTQFSYLMLKNDSRFLARRWVEDNVPADTGIIVFSKYMHLASVKESTTIKFIIDEDSLTEQDRSETLFDANPHHRPSFFVLNADSIDTESPFFNDIAIFTDDKGFRYFVSETDENGFPSLFRNAPEIADQLVVLKSFRQFQNEHLHHKSKISGSPFGLFKLKEFGPAISIYQLSEAGASAGDRNRQP